MHIAIVNESTVLTAHDVTSITAALESQGARLALAWERTRPVVKHYATEAAVPANYDLMVVLDDPDQAGALGYHDVSPSGKPYTKVFAKYNGKAWPALTGDPCVASILSHEMCEMFGDPPASFWSTFDASGDLIALELCDPVQNDSYPIVVSGVTVMVSNYVLPAYFNPLDTEGPFDAIGKLRGPAPAMTPGGYVILARASNEHQKLGVTGERDVVVVGDLPEWKQATGGRTFGRLASLT